MSDTASYIWVTWMECTIPPTDVPRLPKGLACMQTQLSAAEYLQLYRKIGTPVKWDTRLVMTAPDVEAVLRSEGHYCFVLSNDVGALGLCEFQFVDNTEVELQHFGLIPDAQGKGLGLAFLQSALRTVFADGANRIWLHTDEEDSPAAQKVYSKSGFTVFDRKFMDPTPL
jgi:GNAT superfamily N-acetyltransferase